MQSAFRRAKSCTDLVDNSRDVTFQGKTDLKPGDLSGTSTGSRSRNEQLERAESPAWPQDVDSFTASSRKDRVRESRTASGDCLGTADSSGRDQIQLVPSWTRPEASNDLEVMDLMDRPGFAGSLVLS